MRQLWRVIAGLLSLILSAGAHARSDEPIKAASSSHGGQVHASGPYQLELVVNERELTLYVTDREAMPVDTSEGSVKAIITGGRNRYVVILSPAGENVLRGEGDYKLGSYNLISLMLALPEQDLQHAKFVHPKGAKPPPKKKSKKKAKKKKPKTQ
jgi:hypothetical protein